MLAVISRSWLYRPDCLFQLPVTVIDPRDQDLPHIALPWLAPKPSAASLRMRSSRPLASRRSTTLMTPASASPPYTADEPAGSTSMRSTKASGIVLRSKKQDELQPGESPARRPLISTSVVPRGMPRIWTVVELVFAPSVSELRPDNARSSPLLIGTSGR